MYENLHKNVNENMFSFTFLCNFHELLLSLEQEICYSFTLLISFIVFNPFKMAVQFFETAFNFQILMAQMIFSQIQWALAPTSEGRNIPEMKRELTWKGFILCAGMHIIPIAVFITESD